MTTYDVSKSKERLVLLSFNKSFSAKLSVLLIGIILPDLPLDALLVRLIEVPRS